MTGKSSRGMFPDILNEIGEIMQERVLTVGPEENLTSAAKSMSQRAVGSIVVVESEKILGILTERDFLVQAAKGEDPKHVKVKAAMSSPAITCDEKTPIQDAYGLMRKHKIRHLPIVRKGRLVGIISIRDLLATGQLVL